MSVERIGVTKKMQRVLLLLCVFLLAAGMFCMVNFSQGSVLHLLGLALIIPGIMSGIVWFALKYPNNY